MSHIHRALQQQAAKRPSPMVVGMVVTLLVGAARADATPEQAESLRAIVDILRDKSIPNLTVYGEVVLKVREIMGEDWEPTGDWKVRIEALLA